MTNPYLSLAPETLVGVWGMRAAELMSLEDMDEQASSSRDTAFMLLAGAMHVARDEVEQSTSLQDRDKREHERQVRLEVLKRAAFLTIPEHPELWLRLWLQDANAKGLIDITHALESDEGLCELLRRLQKIVWIGGAPHPSTRTPGAAQ